MNSDKYQLTEQAQNDRDAWELEYHDGKACSCHISPPCNSCIHPGNPLNQDDNDSCWEPIESEENMTDILTVNRVGDKVVISFGVCMLKHWLENCSQRVDGLKVTNEDVFCKDVIDALMHEEEDGTTGLLHAIDDAMIEAVETGSYGVE